MTFLFLKLDQKQDLLSRRLSLRRKASATHVQSWCKTAMTLVNLNRLTVAYSGVVALKNVSFQIGAGEIVTIVGPNGSGKTTLLKAIIGAIIPQEGNVDIKSGLKIGYVPQRLNLDPTLPISVGRFMRLSDNVSKKECQRALEQAGVAEITSAATLRSISSGRPLRAADKIIARSSLSPTPAFRLGTKVKPVNVPTSSPSTSTVPSSLTAAIKFADSFSLRDRCAARLSTNLCVSLVCNSSDNLSSIDFASACQSCFASSHPDLWVI